jgi:hypothetical protein
MSERGSDATEFAAEPEKLSVRAGAAVIAAILSVTLGSLYFFYSRGLSNLYGDGLAHVEGARRLFDSLTPGYLEIGSAWLPLFHILASPFAHNTFLWKTGLAGSLISAAAFVVTAWFLFRLSLGMNRNLGAAILSLAVFLLCPSMEYLASTPLTEPLAMMWGVLVVYGLYRYQQCGRMLPLAGAATAAFFGTLTRYDGWYLLPFAAAFVFWARSETWRVRFWHVTLFSLISGAGPVLWFLHNAYRYGNVLDFYNGPHSAKAFYAHQLATTAFRYPTDGSFLISARYYLADLTLVIGVWPLALALLGVLAWTIDAHERARRGAALLFLVPFVFYVQSMAHAAIPIYVPSLYPFTYYNLRYGIEMLPAVAIFPSFLLSARLAPRARTVLLALLLGTIVGQAVTLFSNGARSVAVVQEGILNNPCRSKRQQTLIGFFRSHYDGQSILVAAGKWSCMMPELGIPFGKTLSETNLPPWKQLPDGPPSWVGWIIRGNDDVVDELMRAYPSAFNDYDLEERDQFPGEGSLEIYRRHPR